MRKIIAVIALLALALAPAGCARKAAVPSQLTSSSLTVVEFESPALEKRMSTYVYLPAGYSVEREYPVLYMLHGFGGDKETWVKIGLMKKADELIAAGTVQPFIIVAPNMDNGFGINSMDTKARPFSPSDPKNSLFWGRYEDYLAKDLVKFVEANYSVKADRSGRWVGGLSMGGYAALHLAFRHPDLFSRVGGHSPAVWTDADFPNQAMRDWLYPEAMRAERDPVQMGARLDLRGLEVYLDCGSTDGYGFYKGAAQLDKVLRERGVKSEYHQYEGGHTIPYWQAHVEEYLRFYARG